MLSLFIILLCLLSFLSFKSHSFFFLFFNETELLKMADFITALANLLFALGRGKSLLLEQIAKKEIVNTPRT